jgi:hypothetical protein
VMTDILGHLREGRSRLLELSAAMSTQMDTESKPTLSVVPGVDISPSRAFGHIHNQMESLLRQLMQQVLTFFARLARVRPSDKPPEPPPNPALHPRSGLLMSFILSSMVLCADGACGGDPERGGTPGSAGDGQGPVGQL